MKAAVCLIILNIITAAVAVSFLVAAYYMLDFRWWLIFGAIMVALFGGWQIQNILVMCPNCNHVFEAKKHKVDGCA